MVYSRKSMRWYNRGADAIARLAPCLPRCYVCPTCGVGFPPNQAHLLSREHVPPQSLELASKRLVLTCRGCNSRYGSTFDREMRRLETLARLLRGEMTAPLRAELTIAGIPVNTDVAIRDARVEVHGLSQMNSPATLASFHREVTRIWQTDSRRTEARVSVEGHQPTEAIAGWLRVAYLVAFALFGYRFAFSPELAPVRAHLADPHQFPLTGYHWSAAEGSDDERSIRAVHTPESLRSILVTVGRHWIFLPDRGDFRFYDRMAFEQQRSPTLVGQISARLLPWPHEPTHLLDFGEPTMPPFRRGLVPDV